jgi:iron complex transport system substrate-binding protein
MLRIVSLIASATEIICALGCKEQLVGRSHECDFPPSVRELPVCTETKFNVEGTSYQIDQRVKAILQESLSVYRVDAEKLRSLAPDVIVTQAQCEVCAVSLREVERVVCQWLQACPKIVSLMPNALADVWADIERVADALGIPDQGARLVGRMRERMRPIGDMARVVCDKPTVACIEWIEPLMAAGNWMPELVEMAGGVNLFGAAGQHSPWMTWDDLCRADPDVVVVAPCGFDIERSRRDLAALTGQPQWPRVKAVRNRRVFLADGNQYFNRPGPRLVDSLEILAEILHPDVFSLGHEGSGWQRP